MKRTAFGMAACGMLLALSFTTPVMACGHHHSTSNEQTKQTECHGASLEASEAICEVCNVERCTASGLHLHDEALYCGYAHESGYCDGSCGAVEVCTTEGCHKTGHHTHHKKTYCGYAHESGYCDNSCEEIRESQTREHCDHRGGHRRHHGGR